ncbi:MAG: Na+/H+ antiporter NhaA [Bacteroidales bacterium]|jgi:NhaA family Na+:H+ antiporter|nr:Na+/H+ antiporter NhaA [Bacteroidales bacterium]
MRASSLFKEFVNSEKAGGIVLIACTLVSLLVANSAWGDSYTAIWQKDMGGHSVAHWINDGLMALFFLLIGLELERELYHGALSDKKRAMLPLFAAIGGMLIPAGLYLAVNAGLPTASGAGIPMATDIAFALGVLSLLGNRVPTSLKVLLTALAVFDDLGAILVIAFFYTSDISWLYLGLSLGVFLVLLIANRTHFYNLAFYLIGGFLMWFFMEKSGVHATLSGVLLAFVIPFKEGGTFSPSYILQRELHKPVAFLVLPLFALANTAIPLNLVGGDLFSQPHSLGIVIGLIVGKPLGILLLAMLSVKLGWSHLPDDISWRGVLGIGFLAGIGFTMSIFISLLSFDDVTLINEAKLAILIASLVAGLIGYLLLNACLRRRRTIHWH